MVVFLLLVLSQFCFVFLALRNIEDHMRRKRSHHRFLCPSDKVRVSFNVLISVKDTVTILSSLSLSIWTKAIVNPLHAGSSENVTEPSSEMQFSMRKFPLILVLGFTSIFTVFVIFKKLKFKPPVPRNTATSPASKRLYSCASRWSFASGAKSTFCLICLSYCGKRPAISGIAVLIRDACWPIMVGAVLYLHFWT